MRKIILIISILFYSCIAEEPIYGINIDPRVQPYVNKFLTDAEAYGVNVSDFYLQGISITIGDNLPRAGNAGGAAYRKNEHGIEIIIRESFWNKSYDLSREIIIYHELAHDYFNLNHNEDLLFLRADVKTRWVGFEDRHYQEFFDYVNDNRN